MILSRLEDIAVSEENYLAKDSDSQGMQHQSDLLQDVNEPSRSSASFASYTQVPCVRDNPFPKPTRDLSFSYESNTAFLRSKVSFQGERGSTLRLVDDRGNFPVMMDWETEIMSRSVEALMTPKPAARASASGTTRLHARVLNVGCSSLLSWLLSFDLRKSA